MIPMSEVFRPSTTVMRREDWNFVFGVVVIAWIDPETDAISYRVAWDVGDPEVVFVEDDVWHGELIRVGHA